MLRNPFCFVLQVTAILLGNALTPSGCSAEATRADQIAGAGIRLSSRGDHLVSNTSLFCLFLVHEYAWMPTGGASHQMTSQPATSIRREGAPSSFSGHGSSTNGNMLRNPFCFVLQVTAILLGNALTPSGCSAEATRADQIAGAGIRLSSRGDHLVSNTSLFCLFLVHEYAWMPTGGASHQMTSQPATSIRREGAPSSFSGHGSSTNGNMLRNPFCFVLQSPP
ncbi:uncharacterized protein LOC144168014 [Haemaphysalis longicornis]